MKKYGPIPLGSIRSCSLYGRKSTVAVQTFAGVPRRGQSLKDFLDSLPEILAAKDFKSVVESIVRARKKGKPVILGMGAHPIKVGLSPIIIKLMEQDIVTAVATNGACIVHDFEIALHGSTSEDVARELSDGMFGMARETGRGVNRAINTGVKKGHGIGRSVGDSILRGRFPHKEKSIFCSAVRMGLPATVHVAIGTDIIHMHREADGALTGKGSLRDFRILASVVSDLDGGVFINLGSAVILPEVFLKALNLARNLGSKVKRITTVNMDFIQHYRPRENVLHRPTMSGGRSYALTGHHEIMFPLLAAAVLEEMK